MNLPPTIFSPEVARVYAGVHIRQYVFDAFNELIAENLQGKRAIVRQEDAIKRILEKANEENATITRAGIFDKGWLDVEGAYSQHGWKVTYDKPGYNETYKASWLFVEAS